MDYFISSYCSIKDRCIFKDGEMFFDGKNKNLLEDLLHEAYDKLGISYPKFYKMDNLSKLGFLGTEVLLHQRMLKEEFQPEQVAVILSNASSSLDTDLKYFESAKQIASPALFVYTLPNIVMGEICIRHGLKGENGFFVTEKFDPEFISGYVEQVFLGGAGACVAGWVEVLGEQHNVFLYLVENRKQGLALTHTAGQVLKLYS